jgi:hypothetical protein
MTTTTDAGLSVVADLLIGATSASIDAVAVGTGTNESATATSLGNEQFRSNTSSTNVDVQSTGGATVEFAIEVAAGNDVPVGTQLTEVAAFFNGSGGGGTMLVIDQFPAVTLESGNIERFTIPFESLRGAGA